MPTWAYRKAKEEKNVRHECDGLGPESWYGTYWIEASLRARAMASSWS